MATHRPVLSIAPAGFAGALLADREVIPRAQTIAREAARALSAAAAVVYVFQPDADPPWIIKAFTGEVSVQDPGQAYAGSTLAVLARKKEILLFSGAELKREHYPHLNVRRTIASLAYLPLLHEGKVIAAIEAISFEHTWGNDDLGGLGQIAVHSAMAMAAAIAYESERNSNLSSITRLTQLYDLERVFNSTLQMDTLLPIITSKVREVLEVQAVNLWMVHGEDLLLVNRSGEDATTEVGSTITTGGGIAADVSDSGNPVLIARADDPLLVKRNQAAGGGDVRSAMAVPLMSQGYLVGVLEVVNKDSGRPFDDDDLFFLSTIAETTAGALHNASLLEAERKIEILETLVEVSSEITSTLNLDRVLQAVVNSPTRIMSYDRAAVALEGKGRLQVKAISGVTEIVASDPKVRRLREMLEFCSVSDSETLVIGRPDRIEADREETRAKFREYFIQGGMRSWYSLPLQDDQGRLGIVAFESTDPDVFGEAQIEFIKVVASQATVAVRNASLYKEVPLIGVLQPLLQKKQRFMRMEKRRRAATLALAVATVLFLVFFPLPMRVSGEATVAAQSSAQVQTEVEGVVRNVYVHEGDRVARGTILADLDDWDYRSALAAAQAQYASALAAMNRALAANDGAEAGIKRVEAGYWQTEVGRARERLERTRLRSPLAGVVATPHIETLVGRKLDVGDTFAEVLNAGRATVDVAVDETDLPLVQPGDPAGVKLESFPTRKFQGQVELVSPMSVAEQDKRVFYARVDVPNPDGLLRPGMQGLSKIRTGWRPAGYVLFRGLGMWAWGKLWSWFGW